MVRFASASAGIVYALLAGVQSPGYAAGATSPAVSDQTAPVPESSPIPVKGSVAAPDGFVAFCKRDPGQCPTAAAPLAVVHLDAGTWQTLLRVNAAWNEAITPMEDSAHYGVVDYWTIPVDGYGDCEDYALAKRKSLRDLGLPAGSLRMAVVRMRSGAAHAVLTVATDRGDYVLDNLRADVLPWSATDYAWIAGEIPGQAHWAAIAAETALLPTAQIR